MCGIFESRYSSISKKTPVGIPCLSRSIIPSVGSIELISIPEIVSALEFKTLAWPERCFIDTGLLGKYLSKSCLFG